MAIAVVISFLMVVSISLVALPAHMAGASGPQLPYIIYGYTVDESQAAVPSCDLKVIERGTMNSTLISSDSGGYYQFDLSSISGGYKPGDEIWLLGNKAADIGWNKTSVTGSGGKWLNLTLSAHAPIRIDSNADFDAMHGVSSGSGAASDPYIIENRDINGSGVGFCIYVGNTTDHFVVRNCQLHDADGAYNDPWSPDSGLILYNVRNGDVWDNNASSNAGQGIRIDSSNANLLANNTCSGDYYGMLLTSSDGNVVTVNDCSHNYFGLYLDSSNDNALYNNSCSSNGGHGIHLQYTSGNAVLNNTCDLNGGSGIGVYYSSGTTISNNSCNLNGDNGMHLYTSDGNTISNNTCCNNAYHGIHLYGAYHNNNNLISGNMVCNNVHYGICVDPWSGSNNWIWNNTIYHNNGSGDVFDASHIQAFDGGSGNTWDSGGTGQRYGNWWSDWIRPDADGDGIVDLPYALSGGASNQDNYPRTPYVWGCSFSIHLLPGWNFVSLPLTDYAYNASTLGLSDGDYICEFDPVTQHYSHTYIVGISPPSSDFEIQIGSGYFIYSGAERDIEVQGYHPDKYGSYTFALDVPAEGGWVPIGLISADTSLHASDMPSRVSDSDARFVCKWDAVADGYLTYVVGVSPPAYDFSILPGEGVWIWITGPGTLSYSP